MHPLISGGVYSCLLIRNRAGQSEHSGTTFPIGIIRILDRSDRRQCTQNHNGEKREKINQGNYISFPYSPLRDHVQSQKQTAVGSPYCATNHGSERMNENKQGKIKIQKYRFMFIFIYIYIFTRYVSTKKRKHPKFQNRQSVFFFQMCPCLP